MKTALSIVFSLSAISGISFAQTKYFVEPMECKGTIAGDYQDVHPSYYRQLMLFTSFKSTRVDRSLADSLEVQIFNSRLKQQLKPVGALAVWHMGPLYKKGKHVYRLSLSGRGDDLNLKITKTKTVDGVRMDTLEGAYGSGDSVAGSYRYLLTCEAKVVDAPSRIDDLVADHNVELPEKADVECIAGARFFKIFDFKDRLEGWFQDFPFSARKLKKYECRQLEGKAPTYRCYHDSSDPKSNLTLFEQVNLYRDPKGEPTVQFNLVNQKDEAGGGDYLFSLRCDKSKGL